LPISGFWKAATGSEESDLVADDADSVVEDVYAARAEAEARPDSSITVDPHHEEIAFDGTTMHPDEAVQPADDMVYNESAESGYVVVEMEPSEVSIGSPGMHPTALDSYSNLSGIGIVESNIVDSGSALEASATKGDETVSEYDMPDWDEGVTRVPAPYPAEIVGALYSMDQRELSEDDILRMTGTSSMLDSVKLLLRGHWDWIFQHQVRQGAAAPAAMQKR
jgi:hypothetical protein